MTIADREIRKILTKLRLNADELFNEFNIETLEKMLSACVMLDGILKIELHILNSVYVQAIVRDDLAVLESNLKTIQSTINLKNLHLQGFCTN